MFVCKTPHHVGNFDLKVEAVGSGQALGGDLALPLAVSIDHQGSSFRVLNSAKRIKVKMYRSKIYHKAPRKFALLNDCALCCLLFNKVAIYILPPTRCRMLSGACQLRDLDCRSFVPIQRLFGPKLLQWKATHYLCLN